MKVQFLGNGGFINDGLPYNSFLIDRSFLIECPPDVIPSLHRQSVDFTNIRKIFISHFHGDHYFGMPFITLNLFNRCLETGSKPPKIDVIGPENARRFVRDIHETAVSEDNPSVGWIDEIYNFIEISESSRLELPGSSLMVFFKMFHTVETYGFSIVRDGRHVLAYFPDTKWDDALSEILAHRPRYLICDLNGGRSDRIKVHLSEEDIVDKAIPVTKGSTVYIGTHFRTEPGTSSNGFIQYAKAGSVYEM